LENLFSRERYQVLVRFYSLFSSSVVVPLVASTAPLAIDFNCSVIKLSVSFFTHAAGWLHASPRSCFCWFSFIMPVYSDILNDQGLKHNNYNQVSFRLCPLKSRDILKSGMSLVFIYVCQTAKLFRAGYDCISCWYYYFRVMVS
jgi:hypothetical protein